MIGSNGQYTTTWPVVAIESAFVSFRLIRSKQTKKQIKEWGQQVICGSCASIPNGLRRDGSTLIQGALSFFVIGWRAAAPRNTHVQPPSIIPFFPRVFLICFVFFDLIDDFITPEKTTLLHEMWVRFKSPSSSPVVSNQSRARYFSFSF